MLKKKFGMISLGCDKNRVDGERLLGEIKMRGCEIVNDISEAEVLIVNTCAFLNSARREAIEAVLEGNSYRVGKLEKLVVSGCLPEKYIGELFPELTEADVFLGVNDAPALFDALERSYEGERVNAVRTCSEPCFTERVVSTAPHVKYLKIADGCANHCTYCLIPKIRGKYRSYPMETLVEEARSLGITEELVLVAQDTTRYGEDLYGENKFVNLIEKISKLDNICHIRLLYCYPEMIGEELIAELRGNPKLVKYLDIPLQHSENRILKLMGRRGTREEYLALFARLRAAVPEIALRTTFICGFPTETEEEHEALAEFLREARFTNCGFFAYSREPDTPAYKLKGQIPASVKKKRVKALYGVQAEISRGYLRSFVGKTLSVVCDGIDYGRSCFVGRAYFQAPEIDGCVYFNAPRAEEGRVYRVKITRADTYDLFGVTEEEQTV